MSNNKDTHIYKNISHDNGKYVWLHQDIKSGKFIMQLVEGPIEFKIDHGIVDEIQPVKKSNKNKKEPEKFAGFNSDDSDNDLFDDHKRKRKKSRENLD